jgi:hypothetical protein
MREACLIPTATFTALTWALEIGDTARFQSVKEAISYCGLCSAEKSSVDKVMRMPISKQRNKHIQHVLVEDGASVLTRIGPAPAKGNSAGKQESGYPGGSQEAGGLHARRRSQETGLRAWRRDGGQGSSVKSLS